MLGNLCLSLWEGTKRAVRAYTGRADDDLRLLCHETLVATTKVAVVTTGLNALARGRSRVSLANIAKNLPEPPSAFRRLQTTHAGCPTLGPALSLLAMFYLALEASAADLLDAAAEDPANVDRLRLSPIQASWQELCGQAISCVTAVETVAARWRVPADLRAPSVILILKSARDGEVPCVDASGAVAVPEWLERRRHPRWPVKFSVDIVSDRSADVATALDLSREGIGILTRGGFEKGDTVSLRLPDDRFVSGAVTWRHGRRIGIRLDTPLAADDALFGPEYRLLDTKPIPSRDYVGFPVIA